MCIIAYCPAGADIPEKFIKNMFNSNSNGAGLMWKPNYWGKIEIKKGLMTLEALLAEWRKIPASCERAIHCRIATAGKIGPACCHPFPVRDSVKKMKKSEDEDDIVMMHNGVIKYCNPTTGMMDEVSDTMVFAAKVVYPLKDMLDRPLIAATLENACDSKLLIFRKGKKTLRMGNWIEHDGVFYSNGTYSWDRTEWRGYGSGVSSYRGGYTYWNKDAGACNSQAKEVKKKSRKSSSVTNYFEDDIYETVVPIEQEEGPQIQVPVWKNYLKLDKGKFDSDYFDEVVAQIEDIADSSNILIYDVPQHSKIGTDDVVIVSTVGRSPRDKENLGQMFGLEVCFSNPTKYLTEEEIDNLYGMKISDLGLTEQELACCRGYKPKKAKSYAKEAEEYFNKIAV